MTAMRSYYSLQPYLLCRVLHNLLRSPIRKLNGHNSIPSLAIDIYLGCKVTVARNQHSCGPAKAVGLGWTGLLVINKKSTVWTRIKHERP